MTLIVNDTPWDDFVDVAGYTLIPRKVTGPAAGYLTNGEHIADLVVTKMDIRLNIVAQNMVGAKQILDVCKSEYCQATFEDPSLNIVISSTFEPNLDQMTMAIEDAEHQASWWYGFTVTLTEK